MGVEHLARVNFYSGLNRKTSPKKSPASAELTHVNNLRNPFQDNLCKDDYADKNIHHTQESQDNVEEDNYAEESFIDLEDSTAEQEDKKADETGEELDADHNYAEESFVGLEEQDSEDEYAEESFIDLDENDEKPEWDTPRGRNKQDKVSVETAKTTPRTFGKSHMAFLRDFALKQWEDSSVSDSGISMSDSTSINSKFRDKLKDQLRKELAHSD